MSDESSEPRPVYLIAPLGRSPAVVTETLWYLTVVERRRVYGVELWVTHSDEGADCGLDVLRAVMRGENGLWDQLRSSVGEHAGLLPDLRPNFVVARPGPNVAVAPGLTVIGFEHGGRPLPDIRTPAEAESVAEQLHTRVRTLCRAFENKNVDLIGSIAGGRKNLGSALQGAFELQARPTDLLLHVLLHSKIEEDRSLSRSYVAPVEGMAGLACEDQVSVFEVPFAPLRALLSDDKWQRALDRGSSVALWREIRLDRSTDEKCEIKFERRKKGWLLRIERNGRVVLEVSLSAHQFEMYAALVARPASTLLEDTEYEEWADYIAAHRSNGESGTIVTMSQVRWRLGSLQRALLPLRTRGFEEFDVSGRGVRAYVQSSVNVVLPPGF